MSTTITLKDYLDKRKVFIIPDYQRGYIWGKKKASSGDTDSVSYIMDTIISHYEAKTPIFLQGVTVSEDKEKITLIDGQQRTTFLYILLKYLRYSLRFEIHYDVRHESSVFLRNITEFNNTDNLNEKLQDIYYFKKTWRIINDKLSDAGIVEEYFEDFRTYLLNNIRFLYINIPETQATKVFTMMNGNRAKMLDQEIIKAELLRLASLSLDPDTKRSTAQTEEWELNMLRSRYAREWDKWVHWWNREDVRKVFNTKEQLGYLLISVIPSKNSEPVTFESFCKEIMEFKQSMPAAKATFDKLRRAQKRFEDAFSNPITHNKVGAILRLINDHEGFVRYYFGVGNVSDSNLNKYYLCTFLGMTHEEITDVKGRFDEQFKTRYNAILNALKSPNLYFDERETAFRLLLRLNIDEDNLQEEGHGRKFDFLIWNGDDRNTRSLEHVYPKSRVFHKETDSESTEYWLNGNNEKCNELPTNDDGFILRDKITPISDDFPGFGTTQQEQEHPQIVVTEHSIGNLVLLYKDDNSSFNDSVFKRKKEIFLVGDRSGNQRKLFKSRHLLHTIYRFAEAEWTPEDISKYTYRTLKQFQDTYAYIKTEVENYAEQD